MARNVSVTVTIFDDGILESTENFLVNLADPLSQNGVSIMPSTANVNIMDNDGKLIDLKFTVPLTKLHHMYWTRFKRSIEETDFF